MGWKQGRALGFGASGRVFGFLRFELPGGASPPAPTQTLDPY